MFLTAMVANPDCRGAAENQGITIKWGCGRSPPPCLAPSACSVPLVIYRCVRQTVKTPDSPAAARAALAAWGRSREASG